MLAPVLRIGFFDRLRVLAHPLVAFPLWALNLYVWHVPYFHEGAVHHDAVHALQHFGFVACGFNMWMALLGPLPKPAWFGNLARLGYIIAVRLTGADPGQRLRVRRPRLLRRLRGRRARARDLARRPTRTPPARS